MSRFERSLLSLLFVMMSGTVTGEPVKIHSSVLAKELKKEVLLPCEGVGKDSCGAISWTFQGMTKRRPVTFVQKSLRDLKHIKVLRKEMLRNCSLLIRGVVKNDAGLYSCSDPAATTPLHTVALSVVTVENPSDAKPNCFLLTPEPKRFTLIRSQYETFTRVYIQQMKYTQLHCHIQDQDTGETRTFRLAKKDLSFDVLVGAPRVTTATSPPNGTTVTNPATTTDADHVNHKAVFVWICGASAAALLSLALTAVLCWKCKGNQTPREDPGAEEVHYSTVNHQYRPRQDLRPKDDDQSLSVVYSAVRTASSAPAQSDPSVVYGVNDKQTPQDNVDTL